MTQAITLKFLPCTDTLPDRWVAKADAGRAVTPQSDFFTHADTEWVKMAKAAGAVCPKTYALWRFLVNKGWYGAWAIGQTSQGHYVAVCYGSSMGVFGQANRIYVKNS